MKQNENFEYIGMFIRNFRQANGLSLQALADTSGVSRSMISQIESSTTSPTLAVLQKLAIAIDIELRDLVQAPEEAHSISLNVPEDANIISKADSPFVCHMLRRQQGHTVNEVYYFYFRFAGRTSFNANVKGSTKNIWLESGTLTLYLASKKVVIKEKELLSFSASIPHRLESELSKGLARGTFFVNY